MPIAGINRTSSMAHVMNESTTVGLMSPRQGGEVATDIAWLLDAGVRIRVEWRPD